MRLRALFVMALWASVVGGAVQVLDGRVTNAGLAAAIVVAGLLFARAVAAARVRWRRLRSWPRPGGSEVYPTGPRRVLLADTGLARRD